MKIGKLTSVKMRLPNTNRKTKKLTLLCRYRQVWRAYDTPDKKNNRNMGVHITEDLTWTTNTTSLSKKAQQRLHFLHWLKRASLPPPILNTFYRGTIESVLTSCITVWYGNHPADSEHSCKDHRCPLHPGHFPYTMLQQSQ